MVRSPMAALALSFASLILNQAAFAQSPMALEPIEAFLESTGGSAKFESLITGADAAKMSKIQNFIAGSGIVDAEVSEAIRTRNVEELKMFVERAIDRGLHNPALMSRIEKSAQEMLEISDAELTRATQLSLGPSRPGDGAKLPGRSALIRSASKPAP